MADEEARRGEQRLEEVREDGGQDREELAGSDEEARGGASQRGADDEGELGRRLLSASSVEEVADLLRRGADVEHEDEYADWPLGRAVDRGRTDLAKALLEHRADVNRAHMNGWTALHLAVGEGRTGAVKLLLEHRADVDRASLRGFTPLHEAARIGNMDVVKIMLEKAWHIPPPAVVAVLSKFFVKDGSDPIVAADALFERVAGQGVNDSDAAFAECRAPSGLYVWLEKCNALETYYAGPSDELVSAWCRKDKLLESVNEGLARRLERPVKVDLCEARHITMDVLDDRKLIDALASTGNLELFNAELVECMVRHLWDTVAPWAYLDICINASIVASACAASAALSRGEGVDDAPWTVLVVATSKRVVEEFSQLCHLWRSHCAATFKVQVGHFDENSHSRACWIARCAIFLLSSLIRSAAIYAFQLDTAFDAAFIGLSVVSLRILDEAEDVRPSNRFVLAVWFALLWLRLLYSLRVLKLVGPRFLPIFYTIRGTLGFYFVVAFTFAASVHSYYTLAVRDYPGPFYAAFVQMFKLYFFGDFDLHELEGVDPSYVQTSGAGARLVLEPQDPDASENYGFVHGIFYAVAVIFSVVLMNLFIGILGAEYDIQEDVAIPVFLQSRVVAVAKYRSLPWVGACSWAYRRLVGHDGEGHLCALVRCAPADDSTRSLRSHLSLTERKINEMVDKRTSAIDKKIETLDRNMRDMSQKIDVLLKLMNAGAVPDNTGAPSAPGAAEDNQTAPAADL